MEQTYVKNPFPKWLFQLHSNSIVWDFQLLLNLINTLFNFSCSSGRVVDSHGRFNYLVGDQWSWAHLLGIYLYRLFCKLLLHNSYHFFNWITSPFIVGNFVCSALSHLSIIWAVNNLLLAFWLAFESLLVPFSGLQCWILMFKLLTFFISYFKNFLPAKALKIFFYVILQNYYCFPFPI